VGGTSASDGLEINPQAIFGDAIVAAKMVPYIPASKHAITSVVFVNTLNI
jgi:hypothetical protein